MTSIEVNSNQWRKEVLEDLRSRTTALHKVGKQPELQMIRSDDFAYLPHSFNISVDGCTDNKNIPVLALTKQPSATLLGWTVLKDQLALHKALKDKCILTGRHAKSWQVTQRWKIHDIEAKLKRHTILSAKKKTTQNGVISQFRQSNPVVKIEPKN